MDLGLEERVAHVTGSSRGIGRATAKLFAQEGARVAITYRNDREKAEAVAEEVRVAGGDAFVLFFDLASDESIRAAAQAVLVHWGRIDILVNNAVQWENRLPWDALPFEQLPAEEWRTMLHANIDGAYAAIQAAVPSMRERSWGRIVNVSSGIAVDGVPGAGPLAAAKAALHGLTRTLAKELGPAGILTNVVMPGLTLTERNTENIPAAIRDQVAQASPIRRLLPPEEVAPTIVFLCSAANTAVTGEIIRASGGIT
jgi:NAD(P)-dependent dehydrogenase (short-subunit alcohol dehydrogenase family)